MDSTLIPNTQQLNEIRKLFKGRFVSKTKLKKKFILVDLEGAVNFKLKYGKQTFAYIVVTMNLFDYRISSVTTLLMGYYENILDSQHVIITNGTEFLIWTGDAEPRKAVSIDDVYRIIVQEKIDTEPFKKKVIAQCIDEYLTDSSRNTYVMTVKRSIEDLIEFDALANIAFFKQEFEIELFSSLLDDIRDETELYRYMSLSSIVETIKSCKYRLNCIVAMNDRTEINYVDRYINNNLELDDFTESEVKFANRRFISSLTQRKDDLTLWRMYTDNASGVCTIFKAKRIDDNSGFFLKKVSYANSKNQHEGLDVLKNLIHRLKSLHKVKFRFYTLYIWKHFFKPHEYSDEKEVRLLYFSSNPNRIWDLNKINGIVSPYVEFDLFDSLPIELGGIILGPRLQEKEINKIQLEEAIMDARKSQGIQKKKKIKVSSSRIKSYR